MATAPFTRPDLPPAEWFTAEALLHLPHGYDKRYELVSGRLLTKPMAGGEHGMITANLAAQLFAAVEAQKLGQVLAAGTGYCLRHAPDTVYAPDVSFVTQARLNALGKTTGYFPGGPDLAAEIVSPDDLVEDFWDKLHDYFAAGTQLVWVVYPRHQEIHIFTSPRRSHVLTAEDTLEGGEVVPGFSCPVATLFE